MPLIELGTLHFFGSQWHIADPNRLHLGEIILVHSLDHRDALIHIGVSYRDAKFSANFKLDKQLLRDLLAACPDVNGIIGSFGSVAKAAITTHDLDAATLQLLSIRNIEIIDRTLS